MISFGEIWRRYVAAISLTNRFFAGGLICFFIFILAFFWEALYLPAIVATTLFLIVLLAEYFILFTSRGAIAKRQVHPRLSNGDDNAVIINIRSFLPFTSVIQVIDELPVQFQERDFVITSKFAPGEKKQLRYFLRPVERGEYLFGDIRLFISGFTGLLKRRITISAEENVSVYPSFIQLRNYQLLAGNFVSGTTGNKKVRRIGNSFEFEQVKDYISGDDIRKINWKATARKSQMMVNHYTDERAQQVYMVIDKGRLMKMPFEGLSLLDHAINSTLVLTQVCLQKHDRVGLITFGDKPGDIIPAEKKVSQRETIMKALYSQTTSFLESDFEMLYMQVRAKVKQRSLVILFTNFESVTGLRRQLPYLRSLARHHLLLVVFFENTSLKKLSLSEAVSVEEVYLKTIADKFVNEKKLIVKELQQSGILSLLSTPDELTVRSINKYVELKARQVI